MLITDRDFDFILHNEINFLLKFIIIHGYCCFLFFFFIEVPDISNI